MMFVKTAKLLALPILLLAATACTGNGNGNGENATRDDALRPRQVSVTEPVRSEFQRHVRTTGSLQPGSEAVIRALAGGPITHLKLDIGDRVEKGDLLFEVRAENAELAAASARAALRTAEAALEDLRAWRRPEDIRRLEAQVEARRAEAERLEAEKRRSADLFENGSIPATEWDTIRASAATAAAALVIAREDLAEAKAGPTAEALAVAEARVAEARAALETARRNLEDTRVHAPFAGYVTARFEREGGFANRGDDILRLSDISLLEAEMYIPERFSRDIHEGQEVTLSLQSNGDSTRGIISRINPSVNPRTRNFMVKVTVPNTEHRIKAGSFAIGTIELDRIEGALAVPRAAVLRDEGRAFVWVVEEGTARQRMLQLGEEEDGRVEVRSGLEEGTRVILEGRGAVSEGVAVEVTAGG